MGEVIMTGATGFIGMHLEKLFQSSGQIYRTWDTRRFTCAEFRTQTNESSHVEDVLVHLAADTRVGESWNNPEVVIRNNINLCLEALEYCRTTGTRLVLMTTALQNSVHEHRDMRVTESEWSVGLSPYHWSKHMGEGLCGYYQNLYQVDSVSLRIFSIYGSGQPQSRLIPTIAKQITSSAPTIEVQNTHAVRDFIHIDDVVSAIMVAIDNGPRGHSVHEVGTGIGTSVGDLIQLMQSHADTNKKVVETGGIHNKDRARVVADRASSENFDWFPRISLDAGLKALMKN